MGKGGEVKGTSPHGWMEQLKTQVVQTNLTDALEQFSQCLSHLSYEQLRLSLRILVKQISEVARTLPATCNSEVLQVVEGLREGFEACLASLKPEERLQDAREQVRVQIEGAKVALTDRLGPFLPVSGPRKGGPVSKALGMVGLLKTAVLAEARAPDYTMVQRLAQIGLAFLWWCSMLITEVCGLAKSAKDMANFIYPNLYIHRAHKPAPLGSQSGEMSTNDPLQDVGADAASAFTDSPSLPPPAQNVDTQSAQSPPKKLPASPLAPATPAPAAEAPVAPVAPASPPTSASPPNPKHSNAKPPAPSPKASPERYERSERSESPQAGVGSPTGSPTNDRQDSPGSNHSGSPRGSRGKRGGGGGGAAVQQEVGTAKRSGNGRRGRGRRAPGPPLAG